MEGVTVLQDKLRDQARERLTEYLPAGKRIYTIATGRSRHDAVHPRIFVRAFISHGGDVLEITHWVALLLDLKRRKDGSVAVSYPHDVPYHVSSQIHCDCYALGHTHF